MTTAKKKPEAMITFEDNRENQALPTSMGTTPVNRGTRTKPKPTLDEYDRMDD